MNSESEIWAFALTHVGSDCCRPRSTNGSTVLNEGTFLLLSTIGPNGDNAPPIGWMGDGASGAIGWTGAKGAKGSCGARGANGAETKRSQSWLVGKTK